jgi:hypothetical protein
MITIDAPISFLLGAGLALAGNNKKKDYEQVFLKGFILQSCVLSPVILFFMLRFPDWEWNYLFNAQKFFFGADNPGLGAATIALIIALLNLTYIFGFHFAKKLLEANKKNQLVLILGAVVGLVLTIMLVMFEQTLHVGTLAEFKSKSAPLIFVTRDFLLAQTAAVIMLTVGFTLILKTSSSPQKSNS